MGTYEITKVRGIWDDGGIFWRCPQCGNRVYSPVLYSAMVDEDGIEMREHCIQCDVEVIVYATAK